RHLDRHERPRHRHIGLRFMRAKLATPVAETRQRQALSPAIRRLAQTAGLPRGHMGRPTCTLALHPCAPSKRWAHHTATPLQKDRCGHRTLTVVAPLLALEVRLCIARPTAWWVRRVTVLRSEALVRRPRLQQRLGDA